MDSYDVNLNDAPRHQNMLGQAAGAVAWGAFFVLTWREVLVLGAIVWVPWLLHCEFIRSKQYGCMPGFLVRAIIVVAIVIGAIQAPIKYLDQRVGPFPNATVSLGELKNSEVIRVWDEATEESLPVTLPSNSPTRREVMQAIDRQTPWHAHFDTCANGSTLLFGVDGGQICLMKQ